MTLGNWNGLGSIHYPTANSNLLHFHSVLRIQEGIKSETKSLPESHCTVLGSPFSTQHNAKKKQLALHWVVLRQSSQLNATFVTADVQT